MADKFEQKLNKAIDEIVKNYKNSAKVAAKFAADKVAEEIYQIELSALQQYYRLFEPSSYNRLGNPNSPADGGGLVHSFVKFSNVKQSGDTLICQMGVRLDPSKLAGFYDKQRGDGYASYNPPDAGWIIDNYMAGLHPTTDGSTTSKAAKASYAPKQTVVTDWWVGVQIDKQIIDTQLFEKYFYFSLYGQALKSIK
jgi:hypothetical protein